MNYPEFLVPGIIAQSNLFPRTETNPFGVLELYEGRLERKDYEQNKAF